MKLLVDQLKVDAACAALKPISSGVIVAINQLQAAKTIDQQADILRELRRYVEGKIAEAMKEL